MISLPLPSQPKIIKKKGNLAEIQIENLFPGYGTTIGNTLRRVLLSSLSGAAITQVKIKGVQHEFSTIPGVLEDVITIILNLKQLRFKMYTSEAQQITLKIKGEKEVKGADFDLPTQVELINKDQHIAALTDKKSKLEIEVLVEKGLGYEPVERRKKEKTEVGVIAIDAIFTPVRKVSYQVESMRVGERTDFDRLSLELETDGTISPEEAFFQAANILINHLSLIKETFEKEVSPVKDSVVKKQKKKISKDSTKMKIEDLNLSSKLKNALLKGNIKTVGGILKKNRENLLKLEGMGEKGIKEIEKKIKKLGLELKN